MLNLSGLKIRIICTKLSRHKRGLYHMKIDNNPDGTCQLSKGLSFPSIHHLIYYFSTHPINNVEKLQNFYLRKGVESKNKRRNSSLGNKSNFLSSPNGNNFWRFSNSYTPTLKTSRSFDFSCNGTYLHAQGYPSSAGEEIVSLPDGWQAVIKNGIVAYTNQQSGEKCDEIPYEVFIKFTKDQFEKLNMFFESSSNSLYYFAQNTSIGEEDTAKLLNIEHDRKLPHIPLPPLPSDADYVTSTQNGTSKDSLYLQMDGRSVA